MPLIGFAGAPWTIFAYMIEGGGSKTFSKAKAMLYTNPGLSHKLLQMITDSTIRYLQAQVAAGADMLQVFDSWAGILSPQQYHEFSIPYLKQIGEVVTEVPKTVFAKDAHYALEALATLNYNTIGLDWTMDPRTARKRVGAKTLQGNLDPCALYGDYDSITENTNAMLNAFAGGPHIANLGHGLYPDLQPDKVKHFIEVVKGYVASS